MQKEDLKAYFQKRVGKSLSHDLPRPDRTGFRRYHFMTVQLSGIRATFDVSWMDHDTVGRPITPVHQRVGKVTLSLRGVATPADVYAEVIKRLDNTHRVQANSTVEVYENADSVRRALNDELIVLRERNPHLYPGSIARAVRLIGDIPSILKCDILAHEDGRVRLRWIDGRRLGLVMTIPDGDDPIACRISAPSAVHGRNAVTTFRTSSDRDLPDVCARLGVRIDLR